MDLTAGTLIASSLVSTVGFGFFLYGKKQVRFPQLVVGLVMMVYPYFITGALAMWGIACGLVLALGALLRMGM